MIFIGNKTIFVNHYVCYKYLVHNNLVQRTVEHELSCSAHEKTDTQILIHVYQFNYAANVTIKCSDIDVANVLLANITGLSNIDIKISMEVESVTISVT